MDENLVENRVLGALEDAGSSLDAEQVASKALLPPSRAGAVLEDLQARGLVQVVKGDDSHGRRFALDADGLSRALRER